MESRKKGLGLGVNKNKQLLTKRTTKTKAVTRRCLGGVRGIVKYLKSDSYFYSPVLSQSLSLHSSAPAPDFLSLTSGLEAGEPLLRNEGKLKEKVVEYLKSDTYLYAPLEATRSSHHPAFKNLTPSPRGRQQQQQWQQQLKKASDKVSSRQTSSHKAKKAPEEPPKNKKVQKDYLREKPGNHNQKDVSCDAAVVTPSTPDLLEVNRRVIRRSYHTRLSTLSGTKLRQRRSEAD